MERNAREFLKTCKFSHSLCLIWKVLRHYSERWDNLISETIFIYTGWNGFPQFPPGVFFHPSLCDCMFLSLKPHVLPTSTQLDADLIYKLPSTASPHYSSAVDHSVLYPQAVHYLYYLFSLFDYFWLFSCLILSLPKCRRCSVSANGEYWPSYEKALMKNWDGAILCEPSWKQTLQSYVQNMSLYHVLQRSKDMFLYLPLLIQDCFSRVEQTQILASTVQLSAK